MCTQTTRRWHRSCCAATLLSVHIIWLLFSFFLFAALHPVAGYRAHTRSHTHIAAHTPYRSVRLVLSYPAALVAAPARAATVRVGKATRWSPTRLPISAWFDSPTQSLLLSCRGGGCLLLREDASLFPRIVNSNSCRQHICTGNSCPAAVAGAKVFLTVLLLVSPSPKLLRSLSLGENSGNLGIRAAGRLLVVCYSGTIGVTAPFDAVVGWSELRFRQSSER